MKMTFSEIRARAKILSEQARALRHSGSYKRVVGVLSGLGFLIAPDVKILSSSKIDLVDAISLGRSVEPRILEVLPAAILSFPASFLHLEKTPEVFQEVIRALKSGRNGPDFEGITFEKFFEAANRKTKNRKRRIITERRIPKTFRLSHGTIQAITEQSRARQIDRTAYIEMLVAHDCSDGKTHDLE